MSEPIEGPELVWVKSPASGRVKQVTPRKAEVLALAKWEVVDDPGDAPVVVPASAVAEAKQAGAESGPSERTRPKPGPEQKEQS